MTNVPIITSVYWNDCGSCRYNDYYEFRWNCGLRSCFLQFSVPIGTPMSSIDIPAKIGVELGRDFIYQNIHYNSDASVWIDPCTDITCPICDEITLETLITHCENGICIEDSRQLVHESCGYIDPTICIPNYQCNQPLDGTESDGCGATQYNSNCVPPSGNLFISSTPSDAIIYIDEIPQINKTPTNITRLSIGTYIVKLTKTGYNDYTEDIVINNDETSSINATLVSNCVPNWQIGEWLECQLDGTQTRTVIDLNNCGDNTGKPSEIQICTYIEPCVPNWQCDPSNIGYEIDGCGSPLRLNSSCDAVVDQPIETTNSDNSMISIVVGVIGLGALLSILKK